jgi:hypothetical protein
MSKPAIYQYRYRHPLPNGGYCNWHECNEREATDYVINRAFEYEVRALYVGEMPELKLPERADNWPY